MAVRAPGCEADEGAGDFDEKQRVVVEHVDAQAAIRHEGRDPICAPLQHCRNQFLVVVDKVPAAGETDGDQGHDAREAARDHGEDNEGASQTLDDVVRIDAKHQPCQDGGGSHPVARLR